MGHRALIVAHVVTHLTGVGVVDVRRRRACGQQRGGDDRRAGIERAHAGEDATGGPTLPARKFSAAGKESRAAAVLFSEWHSKDAIRGARLPGGAITARNTEWEQT